MTTYADPGAGGHWRATIAEAQAGDRQALEDLVAGWLPLVYNIVGRALNGSGTWTTSCRRPCCAPWTRSARCAIPRASAPGWSRSP